MLAGVRGDALVDDGEGLVAQRRVVMDGPRQGDHGVAVGCVSDTSSVTSRTNTQLSSSTAASVTSAAHWTESGSDHHTASEASSAPAPRGASP